MSDLFDLFRPAALAPVLQRELNAEAALTPSSSESTLARPVRQLATVSDHTLLKTLVPPALFAESFAAGQLELYRLTFALRHGLASLAALKHAESSAKAPSSADATPVIGCSALGAHVRMVPAGMCRFFDPNENETCTASTKPGSPFCADHQTEAFWATQGGSTQAVMFRFYGQRANIDAYGEKELTELLGRFWAHIGRQATLPPPSGAEMRAALSLLGYRSEEELTTGSERGLRQRYLRRARALHPDQGGGHEEFIRLKDAYDILRRA